LGIRFPIKSHYALFALYNDGPANYVGIFQDGGDGLRFCWWFFPPTGRFEYLVACVQKPAHIVGIDQFFQLGFGQRLFGVITLFQLDALFAQETSCLATGVSGRFEEEFNRHSLFLLWNIGLL
jgi:hypothetical protein